MDRRATSDKQVYCPQCEQDTVEVRTEKDTFRYGAGEAAVELCTFVPVHVCTSCGFEYTDAAAEDARHEEVCRHLGILTPRQVIGIRKSYGLTRADFAAVTRFGEASLSRWETGAITQNPANDQLLYLLQFRENMERLNERRKTDKDSPAPPPRERKFVAIADIEAKRAEAKSFSLRKQAAAV
jgi:putative zinc finger/helix-turn-helix YgiT family protein